MKKTILFLILLVMSSPLIVSAESVAKNGENEYETISEAINSAQNEDEIIILGDITSIELTEDKKLTIDLSGFSVKEVHNAGELYLKNGNITYDIYENGINNTGIMTIDEVDITGDSSTTCGIVNDGTITIKNSTFNPIEDGSASFLRNNENAYANIESGTYTARSIFTNNGELTIDGGTFTFTNNLTGNTNSNKLTINNGTFNSPNNSFIKNTRGHVIINGGTFNGESGIENYDLNYLYNNDKIISKIDINNGTFNVTKYAAYNTTFSAYSTINIYGGTFNSDSEDYIFSSQGKRENYINIYGGKVNAPKSDGIFIEPGSTLSIGEDDGTIDNNNPYIDIRSGYIHILGTELTINFYDGTIDVASGLYDKDLATMNIPNGYYIKYEENTDGTNKAYLDKIENQNVTTTTSTTTTPTLTTTTTRNTDTTKNPDTGILDITIIITLVLTIFATTIINILNKNKLFYLKK